MKGRWVCIGVALLLVLTGCNLKPKAPTITLSTPADGSQMVILESTKAVPLAWTATDPNNKTLSFDVYLGTTAGGMTKQGTTAEMTYQVTGLTPGQTYYWKVAASNGEESTDSETRSFAVGSRLATVTVIEFTTGAMASGLTVAVEQDGTALLTGTTDANGHFKAYLFDQAYDIRVSGTNRATSLVRNYKPVALPTLQMASNSAETDNDELPTLTIEFIDSGNNVIPAGNAIVETSVKVHIRSDLLMDVLYLGLGFVPAATGRTASAFSVYETMPTISVDGFSGQTVPLHVVAYTPNRTRLDQIVYLPINYTATTVTAHDPPTDVFVYGWTSDADVEYYSLVEKLQKTLPNKIPSKRMNQLKTNLAKAPTPEHKLSGVNMLAQIAWTAPAAAANLTGYNVYRKIEGGEYEKVSYVTSTYCFDKGYDLNPGSTYFYQVKALYTDGVESSGLETDEVVPLDIWNVKLMTPADDATGVSRMPTFTWKPVISGTNSGTPHIGGAGVADSDILYVFYGPWMYDQAVSDQQIVNDYVFQNWGPAQQSVAFLGGPGTWVRVYPDGSMAPQTDALEKMKTYEWGLDLASAVSWTGASNMWYSTTIDYGYGLDRWSNPADKYNRFTTGN